MVLHLFDYCILGGYLLAVFMVGLLNRSTSSATDYMLMGRRLTLPAFVMTLVSTWYGGILGVSEYSTSYGISNWVIFGLPYYVFGFIFALLVAKRARKLELTSLPEMMRRDYGNAGGRLASLWILLLASPAPYILTLGFLLNFFTGLPLTLSIVVGSIYSLFYIIRGGFASVVNTDKVQFVLMFVGFLMLLLTLSIQYMTPLEMWYALPASHRSLTGGHSWGYILVWFFIGSWTLVDPGFHQRVYATTTPENARRGILWAIGFWFLFDLMTTFTGLYAFVYLAPGYEPSQAFLLLGHAVLPVGMQGLFFVGILATVMSTLDSNTLLSGITLGSDLLGSWQHFQNYSSGYLVKLGMVIIMLVSIIMAVLLPSVIGLWYMFGTVAIPALLLPTLTSIFKRPLPDRAAILNLTLAPSVAMLWFLFAKVDGGSYYWAVEPFYPGMLCSLLIYTMSNHQQMERKI